MAVFVYEKEV